MVTPVIENELSTGLVIAGAYADKLRRTLFAQLRDFVKKNRDVAREIARAAGEVNRMLYYILVEELKSDKGDVVRIRIKYSFDPEKMEIKWKYETLRIEYFKRVPDDIIEKAVKKIITEKLAQVQEEYKAPPPKEEEQKEVSEAEWAEEKTIGIAEGTQPLEKKEEPEEKTEHILEELVKADPIGATLDGGIVFKLANEKDESLGIASIEPHAGEYYIEAILILNGKAYRARIKASHDKDAYVEDPAKLVEEIKKAKLYELSRKDAEEIIKSKMEALT